MTNFKGIPLFGQDSQPQKTSSVLALAGTIIVWLVLLVVFIFVKPVERKPKYKEVQIVLSSTPTVKQEESPVQAEAAPAPSASSEIETAAPEPSPVAAETVMQEQPAPVVEKAPAPVKEVVKEPPKETPKESKKEVSKVVEKAPVPKPAPVITEPVEYAVDPMEAFNQQTKKAAKKEFDWSMFDDEPADEFEVDNSSQNQNVKKVRNDEPVFSGSAATMAESSSKAVTSTTTSNKTVNKSASSATASALSSITNAYSSGKAVNGVASETSVKSAVSGNGKVLMEMSNGSSRALLDPEKPIIILSETAAATIDGSRTVNIRFRVLESGNVPRGEIRITPESVLTDIVKREILDQISKWSFEPADYEAYAEFEYRIVKQ